EPKAHGNSPKHTTQGIEGIEEAAPVSHRVGRDERLSDGGECGAEAERCWQQRHCDHSNAPHSARNSEPCLNGVAGEYPKDAEGPERTEPCAKLKQAIQPHRSLLIAPCTSGPKPKTREVAGQDGGRCRSSGTEHEPGRAHPEDFKGEGRSAR